MPKKPALKKLATIARPNRLGHVLDGTLYLLETKVSDDYLAAFPDASVARIAAYDVTEPASPQRKSACEVKAAWSFVVGRGALYALLARKVTEKESVMDLAVIDIASPHEPRVATTIENVGAFVSDSKQPVLVTSGTHLFVSTRAAKSVEVFDVSSPLAPKKSTSVALADQPQAAFGDDAGVLVTFLGNDRPLVELTGSGADWKVRPIDTLRGSEKPARIGENIFRATGDSLNSLGVFDRDGKQRSATKLGPTSIQVRCSADHLVTLGDALSIWSPSGELLAKKNGVEATSDFSIGGGLILLPQRQREGARQGEGVRVRPLAFRLNYARNSGAYTC